MIAKFSTAEDLMAHYATVRARLHGSAPKVIIHPAAFPLASAPQQEPEVKLLEISLPTLREDSTAYMPLFPMKAENIRISFDEIVALVCRHLGYQRREIFARRRTQKLCFDRQLIWALAYKHCLHLSLPQIGRASEGRDHTTVLHGRRRGLHHPEYEVLNQMLSDLYEEKQRVNAAFSEPVLCT